MIFSFKIYLKQTISCPVPNDSRQTKDPDTFGWRRWGKYRCVPRRETITLPGTLRTVPRQTARRPRPSERWLWSHHHHRRLRLGMTRLTRRLPISTEIFSVNLCIPPAHIFLHRRERRSLHDGFPRPVGMDSGRDFAGSG